MNASAYFQKLEAMHGPSFTETSSEFFRMLATKLSYITQKETEAHGMLQETALTYLCFP